MSDVMQSRSGRATVAGLAMKASRGAVDREAAYVGAVETIEAGLRGQAVEGGRNEGALRAARQLLVMRGVEETFESLCAACDELFVLRGVER